MVLNPNKDGGWWMCIDSKAINKTKIRYIFPLSRIDDFIDCLSSARNLSSIDLQSGHDQIKIIKEDEWKTTFITNH